MKYRSQKMPRDPANNMSGMEHQDFRNTTATCDRNGNRRSHWKPRDDDSTPRKRLKTSSIRVVAAPAIAIEAPSRPPMLRHDQLLKPPNPNSFYLDDLFPHLNASHRNPAATASSGRDSFIVSSQPVMGSFAVSRNPS